MKSRSNKVVSGVMALVAMAILSGCGNSASTTNSGNSASGSNSGGQSKSTLVQAGTSSEPKFGQYNKKVTITYWTWQVGADRLVKAFEKAYPNITVQLQNVGSQGVEYGKLATDIKAGSGAPDVAMIEYDYIPQFIQSGGLADISQYDASLKSYFLPWTWKQVSVGNKLYAVPLDVEPMIVDYRAADFKNAGLTPPKTWQQFASEAQQYYAKTGKPYTIFPTNDGNFLYALLWQAGVFPTTGAGNTWTINFDTPKAQQVMNYWGKLIKSGAVVAVPDLTPTYRSDLGKGKYPILVGAPWYSLVFDHSISNQLGQWRVAGPPQWSATGSGSDGNYGGSSNAVMAQSNHKKAAALFAAWYSASQSAISTALKPYSQGGVGLFWGSPTYVFKSPQFNLKDPYFGGQQTYHIYETAAKQVNTSFEWSPWTGYIENQLVVEFTKAAQGQESWDQALQNVQNNVVKFAKTQGYQVK